MSQVAQNYFVHQMKPPPHAQNYTPVRWNHPNKGTPCKKLQNIICPTYYKMASNKE